MKASITFAALAALNLPATAQELSRPAQHSHDVAINGQFDRWITAFETCDAQMISSLFTEKGVYAANTGQVLIGRVAIRTGVQGWMDGPLKPACHGAGASLDVDWRMLRLNVLDETAYSLTRFIIRVVPMNCEIDAGHVLGVWRRQQSGEWLLEALEGNKDPAPPPKACPS